MLSSLQDVYSHIDFVEQTHQSNNLSREGTLGHSVNKRAHLRRSVKTKAYLKMGSITVELHTLDVSLGGLGAISDLNIQVGTQGVIQFNLPLKGTKLVSCILHVNVTNSIFSSSHQGFRVGFAFLEMDSVNQKIIEYYINNAS